MAQAIIGLSPTDYALTTAVPQYRLGSAGGYDHPTEGYKEFIYGTAKGAITGRGYACTEETGNDFAMASVTTTTAGTAGHGTRVGVAQVAMADNSYGWFQVFGKGPLRTLASAAKGTRLNTTGTDGCLDDDGGAGSEAVNGIVLGTATGGAQATNEDCVLTYPTVGATL